MKTFTSEQIAKMFNVTKSAVYIWKRRGKLVPTSSRKSNRGKPTDLYAPSDVLAFYAMREGK